MAPGIAGAGDAANAGRQSQITRLLLDYRGARNDVERRVKALRELVELGPDGVHAASDFLEGELERLGRPLATPPNTNALDERIEELRKVLADLRAEPNLTKEQVEAVGLPALDELTVLWQRRGAILDTHYRRLARLREQIELLVEFFQRFQAEQDGAELPVNEYSRKAEALLARASRLQAPETRRILNENAQLAARINPQELAGMQALNAMRMMCGLHPLLYDVKLGAAARDHSADMGAHGFFSHESPLPGKTTPQDRAKLAGTTASGENIYMGSGSPVNALKAWFLSPGHHKNMLSEVHSRQGLGRVGRHWTQLFGR